MRIIEINENVTTGIERLHTHVSIKYVYQYTYLYNYVCNERNFANFYIVHEFVMCTDYFITFSCKSDVSFNFLKQFFKTLITLNI